MPDLKIVEEQKNLMKAKAESAQEARRRAEEERLREQRERSKSEIERVGNAYGSREQKMTANERARQVRRPRLPALSLFPKPRCHRKYLGVRRNRRKVFGRAVRRSSWVLKDLRLKVLRVGRYPKMDRAMLTTSRKYSCDVQ